MVYRVLTIGAYDVSDSAIRVDKKAAKVLAAIGIPVACFLHGYAGFIFGSVKANALWMSPLMPVIFIMSAVVSGIALCMLTYIVIMEWQAFRQSRGGGLEVAGEIKGAEKEVINKAARYLLGFLVAAISLEMLDLIFRGYTAMKSWDILRSLLVLFGVFMMRWNVVIGGQAFSLSFSGYMHYEIPIIPHSIETFKEGVFGALSVISLPFIFFWIINKFVPSLRRDTTSI
jgi:predicted membrane protein